MCCTAKLALFFVVCTIGEAAVLKLLYVNQTSKGAKYLEFDEDEVYRATWGVAEKDKKSTVRFVIPDTILETKLIRQEVVARPPHSTPGYSIVFAKDESDNTLILKADSTKIEKAYFRLYNEATDKNKFYIQFNVFYGAAAMRQSLLTLDKTAETTPNGCLYVVADF